MAGMQSVHTLLKLAQLRRTGHVTRMHEERLPMKILYGELEMGKCSLVGQKKRHKDTLKASLNDFNIPTESWEKIAQDRAKWRGLIRRAASEYEAKRISEKKGKRRIQGVPQSQKKVIEKSRECHNHKPQPFPDIKKRKPTNPNKHKSIKHTKSTKVSSLFPKRGNRNAKRTEKHKNKMAQGKTYNKSPRRINHKARTINYKPQPFPDTKRKRKPTNPNKHKSNKRKKALRLALSSPSGVIEQKRAQRKVRAKASPSELSCSDLCCSICNRQFRARIDLISHLRTHKQ